MYTSQSPPLVQDQLAHLSNQQATDTENKGQGLSSLDLGGIPLLVGHKRAKESKRQWSPRPSQAA